MNKSVLGSISELSQFIESGEFRYAAQHIKQVDGKSSGARWFEWLVRPSLEDPTVTTSDFIRAVESTDLALDLDMRAYLIFIPGRINLLATPITLALYTRLSIGSHVMTMMKHA